MKRTVLVIACVLSFVLAGSPRLPRTSADQRGTRSANHNSTGAASQSSSRNLQRNREQYLFNVFEVIVSTLESKLQRIENLDKAVEHLMRRVEALDSRVNDNIDKTDAVITKLRTLDLKLFNAYPIISAEAATRIAESKSGSSEDTPFIRVIHHDQNDQTPETLGEKLVSLDQKVSDIDHKLVSLKNQIDNNFLQSDDINAEASEKKPVSMSVIEITKAMSNEVMNHMTVEIENLKQATGSMDRKLQFHMNLMSDNLGAVYSMISDVHNVIVEKNYENNRHNRRNLTTTEAPTKNNKIDRLTEQMYPILVVSEKMDQVWNVVMGTKSSVDDLLPKSDELLTQTQRQERAINEIHADLKSKTNKIIENLEGVESRLRKQEDDVATLAQRPIPAELLLDPTIDRLVEYDPSR
ncbi:hypothetical protein PUN28_012905 [Cardiocondyla obscurior]